MTKKLYLLLFLLSTFFANAQEVEMADSLRSDGKIYVVITVLGVIFTCIVVVLIMLERKLSRLEKEIKNAKN